MNKKAQTAMGVIIFLAIGILFGLAIFQQIVDTQSELTNLGTITDEVTNLTAVGCYDASGVVNESNSACNITVSKWYPSGDWRRSESACYLSNVVVSNATGTALVLNTDYRIDSDSGIIVMLNTDATNKTNLGENALIDYSYCREGYNKDSSSRGIARMISVFSALAILAFSVIGIKRWLR